MKGSDMLTIEEIKAMSPEEIEAYNAYLGKKVMKRFALQAFVTVAAVLAINILARKLRSEIDSVEE